MKSGMSTTLLPIQCMCKYIENNYLGCRMTKSLFILKYIKPELSLFKYM